MLLLISLCGDALGTANQRRGGQGRERRQVGLTSRTDNGAEVGIGGRRHSEQ